MKKVAPRSPGKRLKQRPRDIESEGGSGQPPQRPSRLANCFGLSLAQKLLITIFVSAVFVLAWLGEKQHRQHQRYKMIGFVELEIMHGNDNYEASDVYSGSDADDSGDWFARGMEEADKLHRARQLSTQDEDDTFSDYSAGPGLTAGRLAAQTQPRRNASEQQLAWIQLHRQLADAKGTPRLQYPIWWWAPFLTTGGEQSLPCQLRQPPAVDSSTPLPTASTACWTHPTSAQPAKPRPHAQCDTRAAVKRLPILLRCLHAWPFVCAGYGSEALSFTVALLNGGHVAPDDLWVRQSGDDRDRLWKVTVSTRCYASVPPGATTYVPYPVCAASTGSGHEEDRVVHAFAWVCS